VCADGRVEVKRCVACTRLGDTQWGFSNINQESLSGQDILSFRQRETRKFEYVRCTIRGGVVWVRVNDKTSVPQLTEPGKSYCGISCV
jgi:hypothetical protein